MKANILFHSAGGIVHTLFVCSSDGALDGENREKAKKFFGVEDMEIHAIKAISLKEVKAILVKEHNTVASEHRETTPRGITEYAREQIYEACQEHGIDFPPKPDEIPKDTEAQIKQFGGNMQASAYYSRLVVALLPADAWTKLQTVWRMNERWSLRGQKIPKDKKPNKEISIKKIEHLCAKLDAAGVGKALNALINKDSAIKDLDATVAFEFAKRQVQAIVYRHLQLNPAMTGFVWDDENIPTFHDLRTCYEMLQLDRKVRHIVTTMRDTKKLQSLKMPKQIRSTDKQSNAAKKQMVKEFECLDPFVRSAVADLRTELMLHEQRDSRQNSSSSMGESSSDKIRTIKITDSKADITKPMTFTFVTGDVCTFSDLISWAPEGHEYEAAHVQLPSDENMRLDEGQITLLVSSIVCGTTADILALQMWCPEAQELTCRRVMETQFDEVRRTYCWATKGKWPKNAVAPVLADVQIGFIGVKTANEEKARDIFIPNGNWPGGQSAVTLAPPVTKLSMGRAVDGAPNNTVCETEMNAYIPMKFFANYSRAGSMVADFMCGSGSAAVAAAALGRSCLVMDSSAAMVHTHSNCTNTS